MLPMHVETMRHNQKLSYEQLREEAVVAVEASGLSQTVIAKELGKSNAAISRALKEIGPVLSGMQRMIIEHLTSFRILEETTFRAVRENK